MGKQRNSERVTGIAGRLCMTAIALVCACAAVCLPVTEMRAYASMGIWRAKDTATIEEPAIPLAAAASKVLKPTASGDKTASGGGATIDMSNVKEGYIMVKYTGSKSKVKLMIEKSGKKTYTYNLGGGKSYETFPLTSGDGTYSISVWENVTGKEYAQVMSTSVKVELKNPLLPFLYPNQYINFNKDSAVVKKSNELSKGASNQLAIVSEVYNYVIKNISYDNTVAQKISSGQITTYIPKVDTVLANKKGICFDYSAVMAAMLRAQGIPTRMEHGYVSGGVYHAWVSVYIKDVGWVNNVIQFDGKNWKLMDPTFASGAGAQYVGKGSDYSTTYVY
ncbi:transglutaminase-like domain-containing protein [Ruminococcaceae bacterium OttesenSCG-928-L11]|nr:transglutaminase-like domain-containing protein [Ruminococcaceae bacterium OttesenSCG-928-L11]